MIVAFLTLSHIDAAVRDFRARHDPLAEIIAPHITLVHPFVAPIGSDVLRDHIIEATDGIGPFEVNLAEITPFGREFDSPPDRITRFVGRLGPACSGATV